MSTLILGAVLLAVTALALVRTFAKKKKKSGGCAGCDGCPGCGAR